MSILDELLGKLASNVDVKNLAVRVGLEPDQIEAAIAALGAAHPQPGDTVDTAATATGLPTDKLREIVGHIGGEGSLGAFANMLGGDNSVAGSLGNMASKFLGKL